MAAHSAPPLVLVAEDEPTMLELVVRHLKSWKSPKLEVLEASDGEEAWHLAKDHLPDLVVLDVMMPGMSGWEVCKKIRENVSFAHTSVVMLTGIGENLNQMTSPLYGADAYVDKPFEFEDLDAKVKKALAARASQRNLAPRPVRNGVVGAAKAVATKRAGSAPKVAKKTSSGSSLVRGKASAKKGSKVAEKTTRKGRNEMAAKKKAAKKATTAKKKTAKKKAAKKK